MEPGAVSTLVGDDHLLLVRSVTDRVAARLVAAIEHDEELPHAAGAGAGSGSVVTPLADDSRRQQLLVGSWLSDEVARVNHDRMRSGESPLTSVVDRELRARVVAELTGAGPLEPYMSDPQVEEIDVNSHRSTWVRLARRRSNGW